MYKQLGTIVVVTLLCMGQGCPPAQPPGLWSGVTKGSSPQETQLSFDRDLDGFTDGLDPAADNPGVPANLGSPEAILDHPLVSRALQEVRDRGLVFNPEMVLSSELDLSGSYSHSGGSFLMTSDRTREGKAVASGGYTLSEAAPGLYRTVGGQPDSAIGATAVESIEYVRGTFQRYTRYKVGRVLCGSGRARYTADIEIGNLDPASGDLVDILNVSVVIATEGKPVCDAPGGDVPGGWQVVSIPRVARDS